MPINSPNWKCLNCADSLNCIVFGNVTFNNPYNRITTDGGKTWRTTYIDSNYYAKKVNDIAYPDTSLCIVVCDENYYLISKDKGETWCKKKINNMKINLHNVHFYDKNNGVMQNDLITFITSDGGKT
jgi:photosystem II stability/assembly factor-like uncharacterized protein